MLENYRKNIHQKNKNVKFNDEEDNQRDEDLYNVFGNPKKDYQRSKSFDKKLSTSNSQSNIAFPSKMSDNDYDNKTTARS